MLGVVAVAEGGRGEDGAEGTLSVFAKVVSIDEERVLEAFLGNNLGMLKPGEGGLTAVGVFT